MCGALFWYGERTRGNVRNRAIQYYNCCKGGKVYLPPYEERPEPLKSLARFDSDARTKKFIANIRQYNCLFAFTSMGANIDNAVNDGSGPPLFKICGQVHHRIGSLLPQEGSTPQFLQLYIYDTVNEVENRLRCLNPTKESIQNIDPLIVQELIKMLDEHNPFAKKFRMARDRLSDYEDEDFIIRIVGAREGDPV
ncbi:hypothetical protein Zm00014a_000747 [Zea mays]|nr:hypothetical protein Zm00014a_000747 [Zea mays]